MPLNFSKLVFFGDSYTDDGNLPEPLRPDPPNVGGRFTNGRTHAEVVARDLAVAYDNVALGGAEASTDGSDSAAQRLINLSTQVDAYLANRLIFPFASFGRGFSPTTAAAILIGGDDILHERPDTRAEASNLANRVVSSVGNEVIKLAGAGFGHFLLYTLGKLSVLPENLDKPESVRAGEDAAAASINSGLKAFSKQAAGILDIKVIDTARLDAEARADHETFGLKVLDTPIYQGVYKNLVSTGITPQYSPDEVFYFDEVHPTRAVHGIIGAFTEATLRADHVLLRGGAGDVIRASGQADLIFSGSGEDLVSGNDGSDVIFAGLGNDRVDGGSGNNLVAGGGGDDVIRSRTGIDLLAGNAGNDQLFGGTGSDVLIGGSGADQLFGESGNDVFYFKDDGIANGATVIDGGSGADTLRLTVSSVLFASSEFQAELQSYRDAVAAAPGAAFTFASLDLSVQSVERLETRVGNKTAFTTGHAAVNQSAAMAALIHDADLWGLL